jgi:hypothetical protein
MLAHEIDILWAPTPALYLKHMDANLVGALWVLQGTREAGTLPVGPGAMVQGCQD